MATTLHQGWRRTEISFLTLKAWEHPDEAWGQVRQEHPELHLLPPGKKT